MAERERKGSDQCPRQSSGDGYNQSQIRQDSAQYIKEVRGEPAVDTGRVGQTAGGTSLNRGRVQNIVPVELGREDEAFRKGLERVTSLEQHGDDIYISTDNMGKCGSCGKWEDLRMGCCFDCVTKGEIRLAKRTVWQHIVRGHNLLWKGHWWEGKLELELAFQRLTQTGDYRKDGYFDREGIKWREP